MTYPSFASTLRAMGIADVNDIDWLDAPPAAAVERAESLLDRLGATGAMAQRLARYPLPPRLSRILVEAMERGVGEDGCVAAALLGSGVQVEKNDLLAAMDLDYDYRTRQHIEQLRRIARPPRQRHHNDDALLISVLAGFPDRVARRRAGNQVLLSTGASAEVAGETPRYEFMVAVDAEDRKDKPLPLIRMTARIEPEWLIDLFPDHVREQSSVTWNRVAERVDAVSATTLRRVGDSGIAQARYRTAKPPPNCSRKRQWKLASSASSMEAFSEFAARVEFAGIEVPERFAGVARLVFGTAKFRRVEESGGEVHSVHSNTRSARKAE